MGRLNTALNELAERGVFAVGPSKSEIEVTGDTARQSTTGKKTRKLPAGNEATRPLADTGSEEFTASPDVNHAPADRPIGSCKLKKNSDASKVEHKAAESATELTSLPEPTVELEKLLDVEEPITIAQTNLERNAEAHGVTVVDTSGEPESEAEEFKVPSHGFDTNTANTNELCAQLGVLTKVEKESFNEGQEIQSLKQEILTPILPQPLTSNPDMVLDTQLENTNEVYSLGQAANGSDRRHADKGQVVNLFEQITGVAPNVRVKDQERTAPHAEPLVPEISDLQPHPESPASDFDQPNEFAYKPVLNTWAKLTQQPIETAVADEEPTSKILQQQPDDLTMARSGIVEPEIKDHVTQPLRSFPATSFASTSHPAEIDKTPPTEFEIRTAERLLQTEFGVRIQQLSEHISSQLPGKGPHIILLVSMKPEQQRAEAVAGLGMYVCAQRTLPTLLVDADINNRQITRGYEKNGPGLVEAIRGQVPWDNSVQATSCDKLRVLPCGTDLSIIGTEAQQTGFDRFNEFTDQWKRFYGLVIIDGGLTDSPMVPALSKCADATFLCVQLGSTDREELLQTTEQLIQAGGRLKGCITTGPVST